MSVPTSARSPGPHRRVLTGLLGAVRPEFRADVLVFPAGDPVFGGGACRVQACPRPARGHGLCQESGILGEAGSEWPDDLCGCLVGVYPNQTTTFSCKTVSLGSASELIDTRLSRS